MLLNVIHLSDQATLTVVKGLSAALYYMKTFQMNDYQRQTQREILYFVAFGW